MVTFRPNTVPVAGSKRQSSGSASSRRTDSGEKGSGRKRSSCWSTWIEALHRPAGLLQRERREPVVVGDRGLAVEVAHRPAVLGVVLVQRHRAQVAGVRTTGVEPEQRDRLGQGELALQRGDGVQRRPGRAARAAAEAGGQRALAQGGDERRRSRCPRAARRRRSAPPRRRRSRGARPAGRPRAGSRRCWSAHSRRAKPAAGAASATSPMPPVGRRHRDAGEDQQPDPGRAPPAGRPPPGGRRRRRPGPRTGSSGRAGRSAPGPGWPAPASPPCRRSAPRRAAERWPGWAGRRRTARSGA